MGKNERGILYRSTLLNDAYLETFWNGKFSFNMKTRKYTKHLYLLLGTQERCIQTIGHLERIIKEKADKLNKDKKDRRVPRYEAMSVPLAGNWYDLDYFSLLFVSCLKVIILRWNDLLGIYLVLFFLE